MSIAELPAEVADRLNEVARLQGCYEPLLRSAMPPPPYSIIFDWLLELAYRDVSVQDWRSAMQHCRDSLGIMLQLQPLRIQ